MREQQPFDGSPTNAASVRMAISARWSSVVLCNRKRLRLKSIHSRRRIKCYLLTFFLVNGALIAAASPSDLDKNLVVMPLLSGDKLLERTRRERRLEVTTSNTVNEMQIDPLYQGIGTHFADLWVGCPPQRQTVIIDTGSGATAFPCQGCIDCGAYWEPADKPLEAPEDDVHYHTDPLFHPTKSSCFQMISCHDGCAMGGECFSQQEYQDNAENLPPPLVAGPNRPPDDYNICHVSMGYAEGSMWFATESRDRAYTGGYHEGGDTKEATEGAFDLVFGCQTTVTGLFRSQLADGIMGMMDTDSAYWNQLYKAGKIDKRQFSLCFSRSPWITREATGAGAMVMGGTDVRLHTGRPMVFADATKKMQGIFSVKVEAMYLRANGGESIVVPADRADSVVWKTISDDPKHFGQMTIVDSGTTSTYFMTDLGEPFVEAFKELTGGLEYDLETDYEFTKEQLASLPTVVLKVRAWKDAQGQIPVPDITSINGKTYQDESVFIAFPPSHYMKYYPTNNVYQAKLGFNRPSGGFAPATLGANFLMGHDFFFDVENDRIGVAESNCDYDAMGNKMFNHTYQDDHFRDSGDSGDALENEYSEDMDTSETSTFNPAVAIAGVAAIFGLAYAIQRRNAKGSLSAYHAARIYAENVDSDFEDNGYRDDEYDDSSSQKETEMVGSVTSDRGELA